MKGSGGGKKEGVGPRKGWMAVRVGGKGEEMQRFVVPVEYVNHPLFLGLLKEAEEEFGFQHVGAIRIPCHVDDFRLLQGVIDRHNRRNAQQHHHHLQFVNCFKH